MKIAVDCRMIGSSGIGTFIENIIPYMISQTNNTFVLIGDPARLSVFDHDRCRIVPCLYPIFSIKEQFKYPISRVNQCDVFYTPNYNIPRGIKIPVFCTIHDIVFLDVNGLCSLLKKIIVKYFLQRALKISFCVFTVSNFSKSRIIDRFQGTYNIHVVGNGISRKLKQYREKHPIVTEKKGICFIGNLKKYKGLKTLLQAYRLLKEQNQKVELTVIGNIDLHSKDEKTIDELRAQSHEIRFITHATDEMVYSTIAHSEILVSPSSYEGFGIPPLEALYLGTDVIIADIPTYKEIYQELPVTFFEVGNANDLCHKIIEHKEMQVKVAETIDRLYNYEKTAKMIIDEISKVK